MESEIANAETGPELPLAEPHFDDEATLLSARRVVPLDEVSSDELDTTWHFGRGWIFAATIAGALLLGAFVGAAYYSYVNRESAQQFVDPESVAAGVEGIATAPTLDNDSSASANAPELGNATPEDSTASVTGPQEQASEPQRAGGSSKLVARRVDVLTFPSSREERKAARRQARERKRELERESRKSRNDLTRIREIFEGPQKP